LVNQLNDILLKQRTSALSNLMDRAIKNDTTNNKTNQIKDDIKQKAENLLKGLFGK
jgi:hypothetical protein